MPKQRTATHFDSEVFLIGETYYYRGIPDGMGRQIEKSLKLKKGTAQKDVIKAKREFILSLEMLGKKGNTKTELIFVKYLESRKQERINGKDAELGFGISESTLKESEGIVNLHFKPFFRDKSIGDFDQELFDDYCTLKFKVGLNLVNHRKVLNHFLKWCVKNKYLKFRPEIELEPKFRKLRRKRVIVSEENIRKLFTVASDKLLIYLAMYLLMMMRNSEIRLTKWSDIDFNTDAVRITPEGNRRRKGRVIPLNPLVKRLLLKAKELSESDYVFPQIVKGVVLSNKPMDRGGIRKSFVTACKNSGIDQEITPHDLRATGEKYMHLDKRFTDTQREKMAGAKIDVQKNIYVSMDADDLRGLENVVNIKPVNDLMKKRLGKKLGKNGI